LAGTCGFLAPAVAASVLAAAGSAALAGTTPAKPRGDVVKGRMLFRTHCGNCHRLAAAHTHGNVGPNLTWERVPYSLGVWTISNGTSLMPGFRGRLKKVQIRDLAAFLATATNG
jgi:mono/diheme cytochrome c family protein